MKKLCTTLLILLAPQVQAQETQVFQLPAGCDAYLTVHGRACSVETHFTCTNDPAGQQRRVTFDEEGMTYLGVIDHETQWVNSYHVLSDDTEILQPSPVDPASLSELIQTGEDTYDFQTRSSLIGDIRYVGKDTLTGEVVEIDDVTLEQTTYEITAYAPDGSFMWSSKGREFISRDWRMFLSGAGTITTPDDQFTDDDTPVEFIFPGEPGFLSVNPKHGCGLAISSAPIFEPKENNHDNL